MIGVIRKSDGKPYEAVQYCGIYEQYLAPFGLFIVERLKGGGLLVSTNTGDEFEIKLNHWVLQDPTEGEMLVERSLMEYDVVDANLFPGFVKSYLEQIKRVKKSSKSEEKTPEVVEDIKEE